jgi:hypothetical protein
MIGPGFAAGIIEQAIWTVIVLLGILVAATLGIGVLIGVVL